MKSKHVRHALFTVALIGLSACGPAPMEGVDGDDAPADLGKADSVAPPRIEKSFAFAGRYLRLSGTRLYVTLAKIAAWKLEIHEVSNPAAPQLLGELALAGGSASTDIVAPVSSTHLAVSEYTVGIRILQVANPAQPTLVTTLPVRGVVGMVMKGMMLYVSRGGSFTGYAAHLEIWDLANPASPVRLSDTGLPRFVYDQDNLSLSVIGGFYPVFSGVITP